MKYTNENDLPGGTVVHWKDRSYITGNRRNDLVDLYKDGKFIRTVKIRNIRGETKEEKKRRQERESARRRRLINPKRIRKYQRGYQADWVDGNRDSWNAYQRMWRRRKRIWTELSALGFENYKEDNESFKDNRVVRITIKKENLISGSWNAAVKATKRTLGNKYDLIINSDHFVIESTFGKGREKNDD